MAMRVRGLGPVYWGIERDYAGPASSYAWVVETTPPYRKSTWGHVFAVRGTALHFGLCVRETDPHEIARWEGTGLDVTPEDIAEWRGPSNWTGDNGCVSDGFGSVWEKCSRPDCTLQVVRPGKVQCDGMCDDLVEDDTWEY